MLYAPVNNFPMMSAECNGSVCRALDWELMRLKIGGVKVLCHWARHFIRCLEMAQRSKTRPDMTDNLLTGS